MTLDSFILKLFMCVSVGGMNFSGFMTRYHPLLALVYNILLPIININIFIKGVIMKNHYVYRITNIILNKHYYGCRTSKKCSPKEDLGIKYFSSSKNKDFIKDQKNNPQNYKYKIINTFNNRKKAIKLEIKLHNKFNVGVNESFYNRSKQTSTGWDTTGIPSKISKKDREKIINARKKISYKGKNNPRYGCTVSDETKNKISHSLKNNGYSDSEETRKKKSKSAKNRLPVSEETRKKISKVHKGKKVSKKTIEKMIQTKSERIYPPNYNSLLVNIYNENNEVVYECNGDFNKICNLNNLPTSALRKSLKTEMPIYLNLDPGNLSKIKRKGFYVYKGWVAKYR